MSGNALTAGSAGAAIVPDPVIAELVGALSEANEQRLGLERLARLSTATLDPAELIDATLNELVDLLGADGAVFAPAPAVAGVDGVTAAAAGIDGPGWRTEPAVVSHPDSPLSTDSSHQTTGGATELSDLISAAVDNDLGGRSSRLVDGATIIAPAGSAGRVAVRCRSGAGTGERKLVEAAAAQLTGALELADLHERAVGDAIMRTEHDRAAELARSVLSENDPQVDGVDFAVRSEAARSAGGDLHLQVRRGDELWIAVGDVSGKGLPAAVVMAMAVAAVGAAMRSAACPGEALSVTNSQLVDYLSSTGRFVTLAVARHRIGSDEIEIANAGHSPILHGSAGNLVNVPADAPPIGVLDHIDVSSNTLDFPIGHRLVVASDGFVEQEAPGGEMYGDDRFVASLVPTSQGAVDTAFEHLERFADGMDQSDDRTLCVIGRVDSDAALQAEEAN